VLRLLNHESHIITGNPVSDFEFYRPFETELQAIEWTNRDAQLDENWCVSTIRHPPEEE